MKNNVNWNVLYILLIMKDDIKINAIKKSVNQMIHVLNLAVFNMNNMIDLMINFVKILNNIMIKL